MQYLIVIGLARLGHDVYYYEDTWSWPYHPVDKTYTSDGSYSAQYINKVGYGAETEEGHQLIEAIRSDRWRSYGRAAKDKQIERYKVMLQEPQDAGNLLPWVHRLISNTKSVIQGAHRGVSNKHLESYLNEICYRFNRRFCGRELFNRLIDACVSSEVITYAELVSSCASRKAALGLTKYYLLIDSLIGRTRLLDRYSVEKWQVGFS